MLVESLQDDRGMYADYLRASVYRVIEVGDTAEALAQSAEADIIVTGIRVPGPFDGLELIHRLRADNATKDTPVIVLTAWVMQSNRNAAARAGCDAFLAKPCLPNMLVGEIRRLLAKRVLGEIPRRVAPASYVAINDKEKTG